MNPLKGEPHLKATTIWSLFIKPPISNINLKRAKMVSKYVEISLFDPTAASLISEKSFNKIQKKIEKFLRD